MSENSVQLPVEQSRPADRRPRRVKFRGSVLVLLRLPNRRQVRSAFHMLSVTGGMVHLEKPLDEQVEVEMIFHVGDATIHAKALMLFPMWATQGWLQPFRFTDISQADRESLTTNLQSFIGATANAASAGG